MSRRLLALSLIVSLLGVAPAARAEGPAPPVGGEFSDKGLRVQFTLDMPLRDAEDKAPLREGDVAEVAFRVTDATSGGPVTPLRPAAWVDLYRKPGGASGAELTCKDRIGLHLQGSLNFQADVDLNKFFILILNNDHTISVVDPILGVTGITQLYAMVRLSERGEDWAATAGDKELFVTLPRAGKVAAVELQTFKVVKELEVGNTPVRVAGQPDGRYVWVGDDGPGGGVVAIDAARREVVGRVATGAGHHELAFSDDSRTLYVTTGDAGTLSVVDTQRLEKVRDLPVGGRPSAVGFSSLAKAAYVASEADGTISVVDGARNEVTATIRAEPGLVALRFAPGGRWGVGVNVRTHAVSVVDASRNAVAHTIPVGERPHQVVFSERFAYVRSLGTQEVSAIQLSELAQPKSPGATRITFGQRAPGESPHTAVADAIALTGESDTLLAASPADANVLYFMEGMTAPMGAYSAYGRVPRAVRAVDRSLRETEKGVYSAKFKVPRAGSYVLAFLLDAPWTYHCFEFTAETNPILEKERAAAPPEIEFLTKEKTLTLGVPFPVRFRLRPAAGAAPGGGAEEILTLVTRPPGNWQQRKHATRLEDGTYELTLNVDRAGAYYVYFAIPSLGILPSQLPFLSLRATPAATPAAAKGTGAQP
ncbi:MAG: cytochrome D1 [Deltaproteobacteria bacterium]|nr:cytochrome D1 [Deltaproteobacteria bacterium]